MFEYFCAEVCRQCGALIAYSSGNSCINVHTACADCWAELVGEGDRSFMETCASAEQDVLVASGCPYAGVLKKLIYRFKYNDDMLVAKDLVRLLMPAWTALFDIIVEQNAQLDPIAGSSSLQIIFVPVPLHWWRQFRRGFNQSEALARALAKQFCLQHNKFLRVKIAVDNRVLQRKRRTKAQHGLGKSERRLNVYDAFIARTYRSPGAGKSVAVLVDDIYTSGATIAECANALRQAGWQDVYALTVARALLSEQPS